MDKLVNATNLMMSNKTLKSWTGDLPVLETGDYMFSHCSELEEFKGEIPNLKFAYAMFQGCSKLKEFTQDLSLLTDNSSAMFSGCTSLTSFNSDLSSLTYGTWFFEGCTGLETFQSNLESLYSSDSMFKDCTSLGTFESDLSSLVIGSNMFENCTSLTTFSVNNLGKLYSGIRMFYGCSALETFDIDLPTLDRANYMFCNCSNLKSFKGDLSFLKYGSEMFNNCPSLTSFTSDLSKLTTGSNMFLGCSLDAESVRNISFTINTITNNTTIHLGINNSITSNDWVKRDIGLIKHKGWDVYTNNSSATSTYILPKYAGCSTANEISTKDKDYANNIINGEWTVHLPGFVDGNHLFSGKKDLKTFNAYVRDLSNAGFMFYNSSIESFESDISNLEIGTAMFNSSAITNFKPHLPNLQWGSNMFAHCQNLKSFSSNLDKLEMGLAMFNNAQNLTTFESDLPRLTNGNLMFSNCSLNTASVQRIASKINNVNGLAETGMYELVYKQIDIDIANTTPNNQEQIAFNKIVENGWRVLVKGSAYSPTSASQVITIDENNNEITTQLPFYAKPVPSDEEHASYVDADGNYYDIKGAQFIYGDDLSTYGSFTCEADAAANMRLTKIEK